MNPIDLDYGVKRNSAGRAILALGVLIAAMTAGTYLRLADESERLAPSPNSVETRPIEEPNGRHARVRNDGEPAKLQREVDQANDVIRRVSMPWNELFRAMEDSSIDKIALLSVQPDANERLLNVSGEAQAYRDVLTYVDRLDASGVLSRTRLMSHEVKADDPQHPVAFSVTARWQLAP